MIEIIKSLLTNNKITQYELYELYSTTSDEYERKLLSMTSRLSNLFSLAYGDDFEVGIKKGQLVICFNKYYSDTPTSLWVTHGSDVNEYTITFDDGNCLTYVNPLYVEKTIKEFYEK